MTFIHNAWMDDLTKAQEDLEAALDELLVLQAQSSGDVSMELLTALARVSCAMEDLAFFQAARKVKLEPSSAGQPVAPGSITFTVQHQTRAGSDSIH